MMHCLRNVINSGIKLLVVLIGFDGEPVHNKEYLETKMLYVKINTIFYNDAMPKEVLIVFVYH